MHATTAISGSLQTIAVNRRVRWRMSGFKDALLMVTCKTSQVEKSQLAAPESNPGLVSF
jgi:hypothetical protein